MIVKLGALLLALSITTTAYALVISLSEHREYGLSSLDYYLLTPDILKDLDSKCVGNAKFTYSSGDGPKPSIVHLNCHADRQAIESILLDIGYVNVEVMKFSRGSEEIDISLQGNALTITHFQY